MTDPIWQGCSLAAASYSELSVIVASPQNLPPLSFAINYNDSTTIALFQRILSQITKQEFNLKLKVVVMEEAR